MTAFRLFTLAAIALFAAGLFGVAQGDDPLRKVLALNVVGGGVFLLLVAVARGDGSAPPDPVPHAMVLTGIVVAVSVTAFAVALLRRLDALDADPSTAPGTDPGANPGGEDGG